MTPEKSLEGFLVWQQVPLHANRETHPAADVKYYP